MRAAWNPVAVGLWVALAMTACDSGDEPRGDEENVEEDAGFFEGDAGFFEGDAGFFEEDAGFCEYEGAWAHEGGKGPPVCDCYGCCPICDGKCCVDIYINPQISPDCDIENVGDPELCPRCKKVKRCDKPGHPPGDSDAGAAVRHFDGVGAVWVGADAKADGAIGGAAGVLLGAVEEVLQDPGDRVRVEDRAPAKK
jgi:hypothetical protein